MFFCSSVWSILGLIAVYAIVSSFKIDEEQVIQGAQHHPLFDTDPLGTELESTVRSRPTSRVSVDQTFKVFFNVFWNYFRFYNVIAIVSYAIFSLVITLGI